MTAGSHLSIGEVLSLVQDEFPDVTISKIRFLESQGLLDPERTPSGYRKFYERDIERLEWILTQQRDNFLPLKVIRERLDEWDSTGLRPENDPVDAASATIDLDGAPDRHPSGGSERSRPSLADTATDPGAGARRAAASLAAASAEEVLPAPGRPVRDHPVPENDATHAPEAAATSTPRRTPITDLRPAEVDRWNSVHGLTADELADEAGIARSVVDDLVSFSLVTPRTVGGEAYFDDAAVDIARASRAFIDHGVEVRHLRMYKVAAQREAGVIEQLVMPILKQRNAEARASAVDTVNALSDAGRSLHEALLQTALDDALS